MLLEEIFSTWLETDPDFNSLDERNAIRRLDERQTALRDHLFYGLPLDEYLDVMNDQGFDPADYLVTVERNTEIVIANQIQIDELDFLANCSN